MKSIENIKVVAVFEKNKKNKKKSLTKNEKYCNITNVRENKKDTKTMI